MSERISIGGATKTMTGSAVSLFGVFNEGMDVRDIPMVMFRMTAPAAQALTALAIKVKVHEQDATWITMASTAGVFTSPAGIVADASGDLTTLTAGSTGWVLLNVAGYQRLQIDATAASGTLTYSVGGHPAGVWAAQGGAGGAGGGDATAANQVTGNASLAALAGTGTLTDKPLAAVVKAVTTPSTAVKLVASETFATKLVLQARKTAGDNAGNVFIGLTGLDQGVAEGLELIPGQDFAIAANPGCKFDLATIYIDADNAADGVVGLYIPA